MQHTARLVQVAASRRPIAALAADADETSQSQQAKFPVTDVFQHIEVTDGRIWLKSSGVDLAVDGGRNELNRD
jgi:hypothetical protein